MKKNGGTKTRRHFGMKAKRKKLVLFFNRNACRLKGEKFGWVMFSCNQRVEKLKENIKDTSPSLHRKV